MSGRFAAFVAGFRVLLVFILVRLVAVLLVVFFLGIVVFLSFQIQAQSQSVIMSRHFLALIGLLCVMAAGVTFQWGPFGRVVRWFCLAALLVKGGIYDAHMASDRVPCDNATKAAGELAAAFDDGAWNAPGPPGTPGTLGQGLESLWFDTYLHADDIRDATSQGHTPPDGLLPSVSHIAQILTDQGWPAATLRLDGDWDPLRGEPEFANCVR